MAMDTISAGTPSVTRSGGTVTVAISVTTKNNTSANYQRVRVYVDGSNWGVWKTSALGGSISDTYSTTFTTDAAGSHNFVFALENNYQGTYSEYTRTGSKTASWSARTYTISYDKGNHNHISSKTVVEVHPSTMKNPIAQHANLLAEILVPLNPV